MNFDQNQTPPAGTFGFPGLGFSNPSRQALNPYLSIDPSILDEGPQYIFPEGAKRTRGRFEVAFSQIGGMVMSGALVGGATGLLYGLRETRKQQLTGVVRRTQVLNIVMKNGSTYANAAGVAAVMYSAMGVLLEKTRGTDDEINTLISASTAGAFYKCTSGLRKCAMGAAVGLGVGALIAVAKNIPKIKQKYVRAEFK